jgi:hypothetical protein
VSILDLVDSAAHTVQHTLDAWIQIPDIDPKAPPGAKKIKGIVAYIKWGAGIALLVAFFVGLIVWAGGRWVDHHRAGKIGVIMMLCALGGAILYAIGFELIDSFAGG